MTVLVFVFSKPQPTWDSENNQESIYFSLLLPTYVANSLLYCSRITLWTRKVFNCFKVRLFKDASLLCNFKREGALSRTPVILHPPINCLVLNLLLLPDILNKSSIFPSPISWHTYGFWQVQELIVLQVKVGDLRATSNLFWKMFKLIVRYIQRYEVTQLTWKHTGKSKHQDLQHTGLVSHNDW